MGINTIAVKDQTTDSATVTWKTTQRGNTGISCGRDASSMADMPFKNENLTDHAYSLTGLEPGATYKITPRSQDDSGTDYSIDAGTVIPDVITLPLITMDKISASCDRLIKRKHTSKIGAAVLDTAGAGMAGKNVAIEITNISTPKGDRGSLDKNSATTDGSGNVSFVFTGLERGTADLKLSCEGKEKKISIWVCQKAFDYLLAAIGIRF